jgi:hypothetical protein
MRVLLVAPRTDLLLADEEAQDILRSGLKVTPLLGKVNSTELLREIRTGHYDILWLATHGIAERNVLGAMKYGIQLSDGVMSSDDLVAQVRGRFNLVYLNTCSSWQMAQQLQEEANVTVVGTITDVPDKTAYQTGSLFASHLSSGLTPAQAYRQSKRGGERIYIYLAALEPDPTSIGALVTKFEEFKRDTEAYRQANLQADERMKVVLWVAVGLHLPGWLAIAWLTFTVLSRQ